MYLETAKQAAIEAGNKLVAMRRSGFEMTKKGVRDLVTSADLAAEEIVISTIRSRFPEHLILSEEASPDATREILSHEGVWIIDPVDGTTNFAHGHQMVAVSIAFASRGKVQAGVVHAPFLNETFAAARDQGATLNDVKINCGDSDSLTDALVATGFPYNRDETELIISRLHRVLKNCRDVRRLGSAALDTCWVACGRLDAYYETAMVWDIAAASLIAREAGAVTGNISEPSHDWRGLEELYPDEFLVAKPGIYSKMRELLR